MNRYLTTAAYAVAALCAMSNTAEDDAVKAAETGGSGDPKDDAGAPNEETGRSEAQDSADRLSGNGGAAAQPGGTVEDDQKSAGIDKDDPAAADRPEGEDEDESEAETSNA